MDAMTKPMKILFVVGGLPPYAGTTLFVNEMAHQLSCLGCSVTIAVKIKVANQAIVSSTVRVVLLDDILDGRVNDEWDIVHIHGCWQKCLHKTCLWAAQKDEEMDCAQGLSDERYKKSRCHPCMLIIRAACFVSTGNTTLGYPSAIGGDYSLVY